MATSSDEQAAYPPLDVLKPVADDVWIVDSGPLRLLGMPIPIRMTVVRLASGELWLHSPTRFDAGLKAELEQIGRIRHLVAPDIAHWSFVKEWQRNCPEALTWAAPGLRDRSAVRKAGIRFDRELRDRPPAEWAADMDQVMIRGAGGFSEIDFFHKPSGTLVLTDLVINLEPEKLPAMMRIAGRMAGVLAPDGKAAIYLRALIKARRDQAAPAAAQLLAWNPRTVIFSHGRWFDHDAAAQLRRSLSWLVKP